MINSSNHTLASRLWEVSVVLPQTHPQHADTLRRIPVEIAYDAASRMPTPHDARCRKALVTIKRWLDGEAVTPDEIEAAWHATSDAIDDHRPAELSADTYDVEAFVVHTTVNLLVAAVSARNGGEYLAKYALSDAETADRVIACTGIYRDGFAAIADLDARVRAVIP